MPEHTPAPTPARSIYGFIVFLGFRTLFIIYLCWALIPDKWLNALNIYYYPQKYWALAVPVQVLVALKLFAFLIYPGMNLAMTPNVDDVRTITDNYALKKTSVCENSEIELKCSCCDKTKCKLKTVNRIYCDEPNNRILNAYDLDIKDVCRMQYLN